ncbi:hypothetical protein D9757_008579 [Collybiopsis confluens]|uniref:NmrA-like domain-containing protein n=1 Tax=Collybiopsis confluens TaxID=2823264 RepID=A0A8H5HMZ1_9AGAR|nr:hypothetical protein D9757_008579 [Collybiopsis confluens]
MGFVPHFRLRWMALNRVSSPAAKALSAQYPETLTLMSGNLLSEESMRKVFEEAQTSFGGVWGVFCVLAFPGLGANADGEETQGKILASLASEYNVSSYIFSSVERGGEKDDDRPDILMQDRYAKVKIEHRIRRLGEEKGFPWTILRPGFFMENYEGSIGSITVSVLRSGLRPTTTVQLVGVDDIGHVAAGVFNNPDPFRHQILCVVGERSTMEEQEKAYKRATGRSIPAVPSFIARTLIAINGHTKHLISDIERVHSIQEEGGPELETEAEIARARDAYPHLRSFESWASDRTKDPKTARKKSWNNVTIAKLASGQQ